MDGQSSILDSHTIYITHSHISIHNTTVIEKKIISLFAIIFSISVIILETTQSDF